MNLLLTSGYNIIIVIFVQNWVNFCHNLSWLTKKKIETKIHDHKLTDVMWEHEKKKNNHNQIISSDGCTMTRYQITFSQLIKIRND